ncbi:uncharacterized protein LOC118438866 [Folsomia candida]|uniref:uncharacterized protein LOC118438866 n=1 Tax=Folsomia candida TaxID=158441 RepID=UPI001604D9EE|nr:uncharacterized protein LOC118438866 [Folsomia candida]
MPPDDCTCDAKGCLSLMILVHMINTLFVSSKCRENGGSCSGFWNTPDKDRGTRFADVVILPPLIIYIAAGITVLAIFLNFVGKISLRTVLCLSCATLVISLIFFNGHFSSNRPPLHHVLDCSTYFGISHCSDLPSTIRAYYKPLLDTPSFRRSKRTRLIAVFKMPTA